MTVAPKSVSLASTDYERTALRFENSAVSYGDLSDRIDVAAAALQDQGVTRGCAFAIICENCPDVLIAYHAAARIGAVFVPINQAFKSAEVSYIVEHCEAEILLHDDFMEEVASQATLRHKLRPVEMLSKPVSRLRSLSVRNEGDFLIAYTSGSTGRPKAVVFDQAAEVAGNAALIELWGIGSTDRIVVALPLGFLFGLSTASAAGLQAGAEVILLRRFHPGRLLETLVEHRATVFHGVPTMYAMMLEYCEQNDITVDLSFMRLLICAGAPLSATLKAQFKERFNKAIDDYYALTEVRPIFGRNARDITPLPHGSIGKAAPGADIRIVSPSGTDAVDNEIGEILVKAASTLLRYHKDPSLTESVMQGGLFVTGDLGYRDADGFYYLTGRVKDIIIRGGANIAPAEVENVLLQHFAIRSAAVVAKPDSTYGEVPVAFLVMKDDVSVNDSSIIDYCKTFLADFKVPVALFRLPEMPLGTTGKIDKVALKTSLENLP